MKRLKSAVLILLGTAVGVAAGLRSASAAVSCTVSSTGVSFGNYDVFAVSDTLSTGTVTVKCTGSGSHAALVVSLDKGANSSGLPNRNLSDGADLLSYNLYFDSSRTQIWGNGTNGTVTWTAAASGSGPPPCPGLGCSTTAFGKVPASQTSAGVGSYNDTVTVTLNF